MFDAYMDESIIALAYKWLVLVESGKRVLRTLESTGFRWGIDSLDALLGKALIPGTSILLAGNPGAGKTTLAATICYANASSGKPCLYFSFYEEEDRFVNQMKRYGMDFEKLSREKLFQYVKLPLILDTDALEAILESISQYADEANAKVIVVDSFTPLGMILGEEVKAREILQNYFYTLARTIEGIVVIIAEIPYGYQRVEIGGVEFVTDIVLILKHVVINRLISRILEIRKARGAPINIAELPFSIIDGRGIVVYAPPLIKEIPPPRRDISYKLPCRVFEEALRSLHPGEVIYVEYPADGRVRHLLVPVFLGLLVENNLRTLVISYHRSPKEIEEGYHLALGVSEAHELVKRALELTEIITINPSAMSLEEIYSTELQVIQQRKPDVVLFERIEVPAYIHEYSGYEGLYYKYMRDELLLLRKQGVLTFRVSSYVNEDHYNKNASLSDVVLKTIKRIEGNKLDLLLYAWRTNAEPRLLTERDLWACIKEICAKQCK